MSLETVRYINAILNVPLGPLAINDVLYGIYLTGMKQSTSI